LADAPGGREQEEGMFHAPIPANEPVLSYAPGSPERAALSAEIERQSKAPRQIPVLIGGEAVSVGPPQKLTAPHRHSLVIGEHSVAQPEHVARAIEAAMQARQSWAQMDFSARAAIFLRAADLLAGPWRQRINAATMLNQSKTSHQAEIDSACELIDFFRFNVHFAEKIASEQPLSDKGIWNRMEIRPLDGFVYAVTPFNFTSIAGNLPTAPAILGNTVLWKPSPLALVSGHAVLELLHEAGLPPGVISWLPGDAEAITAAVLEHPDFAGLHFTGSTAVLRKLWSRIGQNIERYRTYPRIVGESGGKDFIVAHASANVDEVAVAIVRGGFEFQGQKCSAASRVYLPRSLWPRLEERVRAMISEIVVGDPTTPGVFMGAVIGRAAYDKITSYQQLAKESSDCRIVAGGTASDAEGYFVQPTLVETRDPKHRLMREEIFGPVVTAYVYDDARFEDTLALVDETSPYGLTGAIFARDREVVELASQRLRFAAGNFYVNDKPTGAVVGQQPFGGSRLSGTNDKAGALWNMIRWASPRAIKENFNPPRDWRYPFLRVD
jgi:1-pyrroline-5-carboxylate dehydrogenase